MGQKTSKIISSSDDYFKDNIEQYADGKGICEWNDNVYNGCFKNNAFNGKGVCMYNDGSYYKGYFKDNMKHGKGILFYNDGSRYIGNFENDCCHGKGKFIYQSGDYYLGDFSLDSMTGTGKLFDADNRLIYEGEWLYGAFHGYGKYYNYNKTLCYEGLWKESAANGRGKYYNYNGELEFNGYFIEGEFDKPYQTETYTNYKNDSSLIQPIDDDNIKTKSKLDLEPLSKLISPNRNHIKNRFFKMLKKNPKLDKIKANFQNKQHIDNSVINPLLKYPLSSKKRNTNFKKIKYNINNKIEFGQIMV